MLRRILRFLGRSDPRADQYDGDIIQLYMVAKIREKALAAKGPIKTSPWNLESEFFRAENSKWIKELAASPLPPNKALKELTKLMDDQFLNMMTRIINGKKPEFELEVRNSSIKEAGRGVFLKGIVPPGTLLAFYPGIVYEPPHYKMLPGFPQIDQDNSFLFIRSDDAIIDAKGYNPDPRIPKQFTPHLSGIADMELVGFNPYSLGHLVNHPPKETQPNVLALTYNFPRAFPEDSSRKIGNLIPNRYFGENPMWFPTDNSIFMKTVAFVSLKYMQNEELFLNYRYNPQRPAPAWYTPVNSEGDQKFWSGAPVSTDDK